MLQLDRVHSLEEIELEWAARAEERLSVFVKRAWRFADPAPYLHNWHIDCMCDHLEAVSRGQIRRLIINIPPRRMKSLSVSVMWPAWTWAQNPDPDGVGHGFRMRPGTWMGPGTKFLFTSYAGSLSRRDAVKARRVMDSPWYRKYWGDRVQFSADQNTKSRYENTAGGHRIATSIDGEGTGEGGDIIAVDDPHNASEIHSDASRNEVLDYWSETLSSRLNDAKRGAFVVIMQRLHERDLTGYILAREFGWDHVCLPEKFEPDHPTPMKSSIGWRDLRTKAGELLWEKRFGETEYKDLALSLGPYAEAGQLQQRPAPRKGGMFERHWFEIVPAAPAEGDTVRAWDLAASIEQAGSEPAWSVGLRLKRTKDGLFYIEHVTRLRGSALQVEAAIVNTAAQDGKRVRISLPQDPGQSGKMQGQYLVRQLAGYDARATTEDGKKHIRAEPVSAQAEAGNIKLVKGDWNDAFLDEIVLFPNGQFVDQVDALSRALADLLEHRPKKAGYATYRGGF